MKVVKKLLKRNGIVTPVMEIPKDVCLPDRSGYLISYTHDRKVAGRVTNELRHLCDAYNIPLSYKFNGGAAVKLKLERFGFTAVDQVACIDALCQIYRNL